MAHNNPALVAITHKIERGIAEMGRCMITAPAELEALRELGAEGVGQYAASHNWIVVPHLSGEQYEFFQATARQQQQQQQPAQ